MSQIELIRCFDIVAHLVIFFTILWVSLELHDESPAFKIAQLVTGFTSLFLAITCWEYGRNKFFLFLHTVWEYSLVACLILLFLKLKPKNTV